MNIAHEKKFQESIHCTLWEKCTIVLMSCNAFLVNTIYKEEYKTHIVYLVETILLQQRVYRG